MSKKNHTKQPNNQPTNFYHQINGYYFFAVIGLLVILGLVYTKTLSASETSTPEDEADDNHDVIPSCQKDGNLNDCVRDVCNQIHKSIIPINRLNRDYIVVNKQVTLKKQKSDDLLNISGISAYIDQIRPQISKRQKETDAALTKRIINNGLNHQSVDACDFLTFFNFLVENSNAPTCDGMASQVTGKLLQQPLIRSSHVDIETHTIEFKGGLPHTVNNISGIICDSWRLSETDNGVICDTNNKKQPSACKIYNPSLWKSEKKVSLRWPDLSKTSEKNKNFFNEETKSLFKKLSSHENTAKRAFNDLHTKSLR